MSNNPTWDQIKGAWKQITGKVREEWGELTDDELMQINGERDQLLGLIQQKYGEKRETAESELNKLLKKLEKQIN